MNVSLVVHPLQASILVVGAGYQAVQWACESGNPWGSFFLGGTRFDVKLGIPLKLKNGSKSVCFFFLFVFLSVWFGLGLCLWVCGLVGLVGLVGLFVCLVGWLVGLFVCSFVRLFVRSFVR